METNILDNETKNKIGFVTFIIEEFATSYKMNRQEAYRYLKKYGGIDYIFECWWALHIDNPFWAVRDIYKVEKTTNEAKIINGNRIKTKP